MANKKKFNGGLLLLLGIVIIITVMAGVFTVTGVGGYQTYDDFSSQSQVFTFLTLQDFRDSSLCSSVGTLPETYICQDENYIVGYKAYNSMISRANVENQQLKVRTFVNPTTGSVEDGSVTLVPKIDLLNNDVKLRLILDSGVCNQAGAFADISIGTGAGQNYQYGQGDVPNSATDCSNQVIEFVHSTLDKEIVYIERNGQVVDQKTVTDVGTYPVIQLGGNSEYFVEYFQSRPYYNCELNAGEVWVIDEFVGASSIDITDLSFEVKGFCREQYPAVVIDTTNGGSRADTRGDITDALARGETINIEEGTVLRIGYVTDYTQDMSVQCQDIGNAYDPQTDQCVQYVEEQQGGTEVIRDTETIILGANEFQVTNNANIGDFSVTSTTPEFVCTTSNNQNAPNPQNECWEIPVDIDDTAYTFIYGAEIEVNSFFDLKVITDALYDAGDGSVDPWENTLIFSLNKDLIDVSPIEQDYYAIKDETKKIEFRADSFANFDDAGVKITKRVRITNEEEIISGTISFTKGVEDYEIDLDTDKLGEYDYQICPFVRIEGNQVFSKDCVIYNFAVVDEIPSGEEGRQTTGTQKPINEPTTTTTTTKEGFFSQELLPGLANYYLIGGLAVLVIALVVYLVNNKKKKKKR